MRGLESERYPTATLELAERSSSPHAPTQGQVVRGEGTGRLTVHGVTRDVELDLEGVWSGSTIQVAGQLPVKMTDYQIEPPRFGPVVSLETGLRRPQAGIRARLDAGQVMKTSWVMSNRTWARISGHSRRLRWKYQAYISPRPKMVSAAPAPGRRGARPTGRSAAADRGGSRDPQLLEAGLGVAADHDLLGDPGGDGDQDRLQRPEPQGQVRRGKSTSRWPKYWNSWASTSTRTKLATHRTRPMRRSPVLNR